MAFGAKWNKKGRLQAPSAEHKTAPRRHCRPNDENLSDLMLLLELPLDALHLVFETEFQLLQPHFL